MRWIVLVTALALTAACAVPDNAQTDARISQGRDCFNVSMVTGYEALDRDTLRLRAGPSSEYDVDVSGAQCNTLEWSNTVAIESTPSSWLCVGAQPGQGAVRFRDATTRRVVSCYIRDVRAARAPTPTPEH